MYKDREQLYECICGLLERLAVVPELKPQFINAKLIVRFVYTDMDAQIWINTQTDPIEVTAGPRDDIKPIVDMSMKADVAHRFWLGKINLMAALARRQIVAKGPIPRVMKLLPLIKPSHEMYKDLLKELGYEDMII
ncbi:MAG: SCP2 sterol-binding domain-containing protein [Myxococcota bacterium]|nr:SCP2 sterol-binding domain-containing protein [Myxococcota bacterium]